MYPLRIFLLLAALASSGYGLKCFECNSHNDTKCAMEAPPDTLKKDCSEHAEGKKYVLCRKIVQTIEYEVNGLQPDTRIIRSCGWDDSHYLNSCYQRSGFGGRQEVCTCTTDFCNSAILSSAVAAPLFVISLLISRFLL